MEIIRDASHEVSRDLGSVDLPLSRTWDYHRESVIDGFVWRFTGHSRHSRLTRPPRSDAEKLKLGQDSRFSAALASRSLRAPQLPHLQRRSDRLKSPLCQPQ